MISPKKSLGQNFLVDKNIKNKMLNLSSIKNKNILEIGPGKGSLTEEIIKKKPKSLILIEKDFSLANELEKKFKKDKKIKVYSDDILKIDLEKIIKKNTIVFGNLPYNISSQILVKILRFNLWPPKFNDLIFMFQKELGEKIIGKFGTKNYGRLSILTSLRLDTLSKFLVSPNCFRPRPKVNSIVLHFRPKIMKFKIKKIENLEKITNFFFSNKRKMVNKKVKKILHKKEIKNFKQLNLKCRPSELKPELYYKFTLLVEKR